MIIDDYQSSMIMIMFTQYISNGLRPTPPPGLRSGVVWLVCPWIVFLCILVYVGGEASVWYSLPVKVFVGFWWSEPIFEYLWVSFLEPTVLPIHQKSMPKSSHNNLKFEKNMVWEGLGGSWGGLGTILAPRGQQGSPELVRLTPPPPSPPRGAYFEVFVVFFGTTFSMCFRRGSGTHLFSILAPKMVTQ